ncbi:MAG TPA: magnesium transporter, partial [Bacteroidales bacterium]|nr:magnesium transporter [Bacteroidales bacterium]
MVKFSTQIRQLIDNKDWKFLKYGLNEMDPIQAAGIIEETPEDNDIILFRLLGRQLAKETFHLLSHEKQEQIIEGLAKNVRKLS